MIGGVGEDLRIAARGLWRRAGVSGAVIAAVVLGIGATTAVVSVIDGVLLRPLPYDDPERIVWLSGSSDGRLLGMANPLDARDWAESSRSFQALAAFQTFPATLELPGGPERVSTISVGEGMDRVLAIRAALGRTFSIDDYAPGSRVLMMTDALWRTRFGADPSVVGRSVSVGGTPWTVIGVLPPSSAPFPGDGTGIWIPYRLPSGADGVSRSGVWLRVVARLQEGTTLEAARAEMETIVGALRARYPQTNTGRGIEVIPLRDGIVGPVRDVIVLLAIAIGLVLLIACANISGILLASALDRRREFAVRTALGARPARVARLILAESGLLVLVGSALGIALAPVVLDTLIALYPGGLPRAAEVSINGRVLLIALAATATATLTAGIPAFLRVVRVDPQTTLRSSERGIGDRREQRLRAAMVLGQVALSAALLASGGLLVRTFLSITRVDTGFEPSNLLTFNVSLSGSRYPELEQEVGFYESLLGRIRSMPGVQAAGTSTLLPLAPGEFLDGFIREGYDDAMPDLPTARLHNVTAGFFEALEIPVIAGRTIRAQDDARAPAVVVVSRAFVERYYPAGALGRRIRFHGRLHEIVGVVADTRHAGLRTAVEPAFYMPAAQNDNPRLLAWVAVRTSGDASAQLPAIRAAVAELDPGIALADIAMMRTRIDGTIAPDRFRAFLIGSLALLALSLTILGIYGMIACAVARETRSIAIRMALGATSNGTLRSVLVRVLALTAAGVTAGLALALAGGRVFASFIAGGISRHDPLTFAAVILLFLVTATVAALGPGLRASRIEPMLALRQD